MPLKKTNGLYRGKVRIGVTQDGKPIDKFVSGKTVKELEVAKEAARDHFIYYAWKHMDTDLLTERLFHEDLNVNDTRIKGILATQQFWHPKEGAPAFHIDGLNTERGYWTLWEVTLGSDAEDKRMLSIFINENGIYRHLCPALQKEVQI